MKQSYLILLTAIIFPLAGCLDDSDSTLETRESLGEKIFNDTALSRDGTQSCASCHDIDHAFIDSRLNTTSIDTATPGAASLGQDDLSLGDINTPSITYSALVPEFHFDDTEGLFMGGQFLNGRADNLVEQAKQPFLNPVEMQNDKEGVVQVVKAIHGASMRSLYGDNIFENTETAFNAIADSIAAFEKTENFASFDSKFDKVLRGEAEFTTIEQLGHNLFVAEDKANCAACHPVPNMDSEKVESLFTDFTYDNLGVPVNNLVRAQNGKKAGFTDDGLLNNPAVNDPELKRRIPGFFFTKYRRYRTLYAQWCIQKPGNGCSLLQLP